MNFFLKREYVKDQGHRCIAGIAIVPETGQYRIYVTWEWQRAADDNFFKMYRSRELYSTVNENVIAKVADTGRKVVDQEEMKNVMPWLFNTNND